MADNVPIVNDAFPNLFDIGVREQVSLALCNSASDTFFLLSGPPSFLDSGMSTAGGQVSGVADSASLGKMCPLLFTMSFADQENKQPDQQIGSFGTANTVTAPSPFTPTYKAISVGAAAYVTSNPCAKKGDRDDTAYMLKTPEDGPNKWNLLKRLYYWLLADTELMGEDAGEFRGLYIGNESEKPNAVAPDDYEIWGNFAKSDLYKVPFGLMAVICDKNKYGQAIRYYEGCVLQQAGNSNIDAGLGRVTTYQGTDGFSCTYAKCRTFTRGEINTMIPGSYESGSNAGFLQKVLERFGQ